MAGLGINAMNAPQQLIKHDLTALVSIALGKDMTRRTYDTGYTARHFKTLERMGLIYRVKSTPHMIVWGLTAQGRAAVLQQVKPHWIYPTAQELEGIKARFAELDRT